MSQENVEMFKRGADAYNRRDVEALLDTVDTEVSGVATETQVAWLVDFEDGKGIRIREYLDSVEALRAAGVRK